MYGMPSGAGYDRALTTFSPQGDVFQVQYATEAVKKGGLAIAIIYKGGILFGTRKQHESPLLVQDSLNKITQLDENTVAVFSGMVGDARKLIANARQFAENHRIVYGEEVSVQELVKHLADVVQVYTQYGGVRPYGVTLVIGGVSEDGVNLLEIPPDGSVIGLTAGAIGENSDAVLTYLEKHYKADIDFDQALNLFLEALKVSSGKKAEKLKPEFLELAVLNKKEFKRFNTEDIKSMMK